MNTLRNQVGEVRKGPDSGRESFGKPRVEDSPDAIRAASKVKMLAVVIAALAMSAGCLEPFPGASRSQSDAGDSIDPPLGSVDSAEDESPRCKVFLVMGDTRGMQIFGVAYEPFPLVMELFDTEGNLVGSPYVYNVSDAGDFEIDESFGGKARDGFTVKVDYGSKPTSIYTLHDREDIPEMPVPGENSVE